jgi:hypothetical protein
MGGCSLSISFTPHLRKGSLSWFDSFTCGRGGMCAGTATSAGSECYVAGTTFTANKVFDEKLSQPFYLLSLIKQKIE